nr:zinc finger, CCHC-type [Tanacetum cinerariifolium]
MDEAISVSCVIDKLPHSWKDFKKTLKHRNEELTLVELGSHLCIEKSLKAQEIDKQRANVIGTSIVNMVEHKNSTKYNDNKGKRKHHDNTKVDPSKKSKLTCWKCDKTGHLIRDCKGVKIVSSPVDTSEKLRPNNSPAVSQFEYSMVIGRLMYAVTCTRLDIAFVVGGGDISWDSKKHTCITSSKMESEFVALAVTSKEVEWSKNPILEIPLWSKPISPIFIIYDSATTLEKAYSQIYNGKSRHIGVSHIMIHELIMNGVISI